jgi:mono/diheme cytochrome c family protein
MEFDCSIEFFMNTFQKKCRLYFWAYSLCAIISGCSSNPAPGAGRQAVQDKINQDAQGRIKLKNFRKTNGQMAEINAVKVYSLAFDAEIEFTEDCKWVTGVFGQQPGFVTAKLVAQPTSGFSWNKFMDDSSNPGKAVKQGQRVNIDGVITFEITENGWAVDGISIKNATLGELQPSSDTAVIEKGRQTYAKFCAPCHRADGGGLVGSNLTDDYWIHGSTFADTLTVIENGVPEKGCITWKNVLKSDEISAVASYIYTLRGAKLATPGKLPENHPPTKPGKSPFE